QTYLSIHIETNVERGNSSTITGDLIKVNSKWKLFWTWEATFRGTQFYGTTIVYIRENSTEMDGLYFTNSDITNVKCTSGTFQAKKL
ncbi:MAG: hypothetical protein DSY46_01225, partial [Hydrogenimonas sp.]